MALKECPECNTAVWSGATACPSCAYPMGNTAEIQWGSDEDSTLESEHNPVASPHPAETKLTAFKQIATRMALAIPLFLTGAEFNAPPAILIAMGMAASCVPVWWKASRKVKLGAGSGGLVTEAQLARAIQDVEYRSQLQLEEAQELHSQRVVDLEERLDFAERLLTRGKDAAGN